MLAAARLAIREARLAIAATQASFTPPSSAPGSTEEVSDRSHRIGNYLRRTSHAAAWMRLQPLSQASLPALGPRGFSLLSLNVLLPNAVDGW